MSHFSVLVTRTNHTDVETQLAPFDENLDVPEYVKYTREQLIANERKEFEEYRDSTYAKFLRDPEAYKVAHANNIRHLHYVEYEFPNRFQWGDDEFYQNAIRGYEPEDLTPLGGVYSKRNPKSQWDWWEVGGRWTGYLKLNVGASGQLGEPGVFNNKPIHDADVALVKDVDWDSMKASAQEKAEQKWAEYEVKVSNGEQVHPYLDYGIEKGDTRETYIARRASVSTFAVVHNGEWYEKGDMGWWGIVSDRKSLDDWETQFQKVLVELAPDDEITIVDCHI